MPSKCASLRYLVTALGALTFCTAASGSPLWNVVQLPETTSGVEPANGTRAAIKTRSVQSSTTFSRPYSHREPKKSSHKILAYVYGQTVAEISRDPLSNELLYCKLTEIMGNHECEKELRGIKAPLTPWCPKKMMDLIKKCRYLQDQHDPSEGRNIGDDTGFLDGLATGIYPGTKWCGKGHKAQNYFDLGSEFELDKCCRAHDHCPIKVRRWSSGYGQDNWSFYTHSHCDCDADFFNCLHEADSNAADIVGALYFNTLKVPCLREDPGTNMCPPRESYEQPCPASLQDMLQLQVYQPEYIFYGKNRTEESKKKKPSERRFVSLH